MLKTLDIIERVILWALVVPVVIIVFNAILKAFSAQPDNVIVDTIDRTADAFTLEAFETMFRDQSYVQTALVTLAIYGIVTLLVVLVFRALRSVAPSGSDRSARS